MLGLGTSGLARMNGRYNLGFVEIIWREVCTIRYSDYREFSFVTELKPVCMHSDGEESYCSVRYILRS